MNIMLGFAHILPNLYVIITIPIIHIVTAGGVTKTAARVMNNEVMLEVTPNVLGKSGTITLTRIDMKATAKVQTAIAPQCLPFFVNLLLQVVA